MNINEFQMAIENHSWIDSRISELECYHMFDECQLSFLDENEKKITCCFSSCYSVNFNHDKNYDKMRPVKQMDITQIPYFLQDITIVKLDNGFFEIKIDAYPISLKIQCKELNIKEKS